MMSQPDSIFRYRPMTMFSMAELATSTFWMSSVKNFNDPFEFQFAVEKLEDTESNREFVMACLVEESGMSREDLEQKLSLDDYFDSVQLPCEPLIQAHKTRGVCCFSEIKDSVLMWGHYCEGHTGFVIEYDASRFPFNHTIAVEYSDNLCRFSPRDIIENHKECLEKTLTTKATAWSYERERRLIHDHEKNNISVAHDPLALKAIYFGAKCTRQNIEIICNLTNHLEPKYFATQLDRESYRLKFVPLKYTPAKLIGERANA